MSLQMGVRETVGLGIFHCTNDPRRPNVLINPRLESLRESRPTGGSFRGAEWDRQAISGACPARKLLLGNHLRFCV